MRSKGRLEGIESKAISALALLTVAALFLSPLLSVSPAPTSSEMPREAGAYISGGPDMAEIVLYLHDDGTFTLTDDTDFMNTDGPYNPLVYMYDYDDDGKWGVTLKKANSPVPPQRHHYFVLTPPVNAPIHILGDGNFSFWGGSRDNSSRMDILAFLHDSADETPGDDVLIASGSMYLDPFPSDWRLHSIIFSSIDYVLPANHSLILEIRRGDTNNDEFYLLYDQDVLDSALRLTISTHFAIDELRLEDSEGIARSEFGDQESFSVYANVSNAIGSYDLATAEVTIIDVATSEVTSSTGLSVVSVGPSPLSSWKLYGSTLGPIPGGDYLVNVTVRDNSGNLVHMSQNISVTTVDHFAVSTPSQAQAGSPFQMTIEALNSTDELMVGWSGVISLDAIDLSTGLPISGLSVTSVTMLPSDNGTVTITQNFSKAPKIIKIRAICGASIGESQEISVFAGQIVSLTLSETDVLLNSGDEAVIDAIGTDSLGNMNTTWDPYWTLDPDIGLMVKDGTALRLTGVTVGSATLRCEDNSTGLWAEANITVLVSSLAQIVVTAENSVVWQGTSTTVYATGYDAYGNPIDVSSATWSITGFSMSWMSGAGSTRTFSAGMIPETGSVSVTMGGVTGHLDMSVVVPPWGPRWGALNDAPFRGLEDQPWSVDLSVYWTDVNGTADLVWFVTGVNTSLLMISHDPNPAKRGLCHIIPQPDAFGENTVLFWVRDPDGYHNYREITIVVVPVNDPPMFVNNPPNELYVKFDRPYEFDYSYYVFDVDTDKSLLMLSATPTEYVTFDGLVATYLLPDLYSGKEYYRLFTITVSDGHPQGSDSITIKVWATTNTPPDLVKPLPDVTIYEGDMNVELFCLDDYFMDLDGDLLYYSRGYEHVEIEITPLTHIVFISSPTEWSGTTSAVFIAHDPKGAIRTDTIQITVLPVNDPPRIEPIGTVHVRYDLEYRLDLRPYVWDPDNSFDELIIVTSDPENAAYRLFPYPHLSILYPGSLTGGEYVGPYEVHLTLSVTDLEGLYDSRPFVVRVSDNSPPILVYEPVSFVQFPEDGYLGKPNSLNLIALVIDPDGDELSFQTIGGENVTVIIDSDGWVNFSAVKDWSGIEVITFKAYDPHGAWVSFAVTVTVIPVDDPPVLYQIPDVVHYGPRQWSMSIEGYVYDVDTPLSMLTVVIVKPERGDSEQPMVQAVGLVLYFDIPEGVDSFTVILYVRDRTSSSDIVEFKVEMKRTLAEMIGYPWSLPLVLLLAGFIGYLLARRLPMPFDIQDLFTIHNDGRLIYHVGGDDDNGLDRDVVSAMFTAVQEFIKDSFSAESGSLKMLEFGDKKIVIEKGRWIYAALIYTGWPPRSIFKLLRSFVTDIEAGFGRKVEHWDGTLRSLPGLKEMSQDMLNNRYIPRSIVGTPVRAPGPAEKDGMTKPTISDEELVDLIDTE